MRQYKFGFDVPAFILFLLIMAPNFIWFAIPAPNDVLRVTSSPAALDAASSVCQILMVAALCLLVNREKERLRATPLTVWAAVCCLLYFVCWAVYYTGIVNAAIILGLTLLPCGAFLLFAVARKNKIAAGLAVLFALLHLIHGIIIL